MQTIENVISDKDRAYRRRLAAEGQHQLVVALPRETVALLDELKERQGLRNRSQVLMQLIERGREAAQQQTT
jgi:metal-responsive CopG/Arc/MetJ family transcriptional regulator